MADRANDLYSQAAAGYRQAAEGYAKAARMCTVGERIGIVGIAAALLFAVISGLLLVA